jgi:phosphopantetheinyl transferase
LNQSGFDSAKPVLYLTEDEVVTASRYREASAAARFCRRRIFRRCLVSHLLDREPEEIVFSFTSLGKPRVVEFPDEISCSSSEEFDVFAVSNREGFGIDVERVVQLDHVDMLVKDLKICATLRDLMQVLPKYRYLIFYFIWTAIEAALKATGLGLTLSLDKVSLTLTDFIYVDVTLSEGLVRYRAHHFFLAEKNLMCVCVPDSETCAITKMVPERIVGDLLVNTVQAFEFSVTQFFKESYFGSRAFCSTSISEKNSS